MEAGATVPFAFLPWGAVPFPTLPWGSTPQTWPPILTELVGINNYLNSKILTLRPCRRTLWQSQASCLLPCRLDNILIGSVACCVLLFDFCFADIVCWGVYWLKFPYCFSLPFLARRGKRDKRKNVIFLRFRSLKKGHRNFKQILEKWAPMQVKLLFLKCPPTKKKPRNTAKLLKNELPCR